MAVSKTQKYQIKAVPEKSEIGSMGQSMVFFHAIDRMKCSLFDFYLENSTTWPDLNEMWTKIDGGKFSDVQ